MSFLAQALARRLWAAMLWFMRRKWMKRLQRSSVTLFPEGPRRDKAWEGFRNQERFARKYGLRILTGVITVCLYSILLLVLYNVVYLALEQGWLPTRETESG